MPLLIASLYLVPLLIKYIFFGSFFIICESESGCMTLFLGQFQWWVAINVVGVGD